MRLQGKLALITGGSEGIGLAIGEAFAREGAKLCIVGRKAEKLARAQQHLGEAVESLTPADLATDQGIDTVVEQIKTAGRALDILLRELARLSEPMIVFAESVWDGRRPDGVRPRGST